MYNITHFRKYWFDTISDPITNGKFSNRIL
jgi:hypothetical protein